MQNHRHDPRQALRDVQHFGEEGGVVPVMDMAASSTFLDPLDMEKAFRGEVRGCYLYSRHSNPTVQAFGKKLAAMEAMEAALGVASGMAAISSTIEQIFQNSNAVGAGRRRGHIVSSRVVYGGTYALFAHVLPRQGIETTFVDPDDLAAVEKAIQPDTRILYTETMSNPLLAVSDLPKLSAIARKHNLKLVVDNTFTSLIVTPAQHGADVVVYSCTKYISGANDLIAGAIVSSREFIDSLIDVNTGIVMLKGPVMDARVAHELYLRLDHLPVRMEAHSKSAAFIARGMAEAGVKVIYPGNESHPQRRLLDQLMNHGFGYGGMMTVDCSTLEAALRLAGMLQQEKFGLYAVSLGFSRTLMSCSSSSTSSEIPEAKQQVMGLTPGLLRLSIGFTGDDRVMLHRFVNCFNQLCRK